MKISRILHAGYVFECDGTQIAFDPIFENPFSRNCHAFPDVRFERQQIKDLKFAAVFISHFHDDHCSLESLDLLDRETPIYMYCQFEELFSLVKELGFAHVYPIEIDVPISVGSFEVIPRRALDEDVDSIFHIKAAGLNVLNVVDSWIDPSTLDLLARSGPWDMILWPFQTMREIEVLSPSRFPLASRELPPEWIEQLKILNPRYVVPSSCQFIQENWSWYNHAFFPISYRQFKHEVESALADSKVIRMDPSISVSLSEAAIEKSSPLPWVQPVGSQDVDYEYDEELKPPPTSEIAMHFASLTSDQTERIHEYCRHGLIERFKELGPSADRYFNKKRLWRLSVYDHIGEATHYHYTLDEERIELVSGDAGPLTWTTEVPASKLHAALELGESLTSMYMRINDIVFPPEIEAEVRSADVVEDPLVRSLFSGVFGAYQRAQLKKLKAAQLFVSKQ